MNATKESLIAEIEKRVSDKILEQSNADLLIKLINNADSLDETINIAALGTTYKRTGLHFDKRLEKMSDTIKYFKKNEKLSFHTDDSKPTHKLIIGDNYEALQNLLIQYKGKIDVIYIDPPYGKDSMGEFAATNYNNAITRDNLLSMLYPRLILAKQLLSDEGVIFCSIDDKNQAYVKCLFDEVFGERNFVGMFMWYKSETPPNLSKKIKKNLEYVLCYQRKKDDSKFRGFKTTSSSSDPVTKPQNSIKEWVIPANTLKIKREDGVIKAGVYGTDKFPNLLKNDLIIKSGTNANQVVFENKFIWTQETLEETLPTIDMFLSEKLVLSYKRFEYDTSVPSNLIDASVEVTTTEKASAELRKVFGDDMFEYPKPVDLISYLTSFKDSKDSIILDFFVGSGTTGHAVLDLNEKDGGRRQYIVCQLNENLDDALKTASGNSKAIIENQIALCEKFGRPHELSEITVERLRRIMTGKCYDGTKDFEWAKKNKPYGGNLDVYEIESVSNFEWAEGKTPFDVIDETLYGQEKFATIKEKIDWVCGNFDKTQKYLEQQKAEE